MYNLLEFFLTKIPFEVNVNEYWLFVDVTVSLIIYIPGSVIAKNVVVTVPAVGSTIAADDDVEVNEPFDLYCTSG